jgi:hypothetical protein
LYFFHCFSTDQSETELLYFYLLFFSVKSRFKKSSFFSGSTMTRLLLLSLLWILSTLSLSSGRNNFANIKVFMPACRENKGRFDREGFYITRNLCYVISEFCHFSCRWRCPQGWAEQSITIFLYAV